MSFLTILLKKLHAPPDYIERLRPSKQPSSNVQLRELFQFRCSWQWVVTGITGSLGVATLLAIAVRWRATRLPIGVSLASIGFVTICYATLIEPRRPVLERITIVLPALPPELDGIRIGHLSDFHLDFIHTRANVRWAQQQMHAEAPDVLVFTGDFVSFSRAIPLLSELFRGFHAPLGMYAVPGNHDHWEGVDAICEQLERAGVTMLLNAHKQLTWRGGTLWLAGVDDMWYGTPDIAAALDGVPPDVCTLLLAHPPDYADIAVHHPIALQISGHTHGGHMRLPLLGWFCVPYHGFRYISGLEHIGTLLLYVTRGLGGMPLRFNCPPEATIITLRSHVRP